MHTRRARTSVVLLAAVLVASVSASIRTPSAHAYATTGYKYQFTTIYYAFGSITSYDRTAFSNGANDWTDTPTPLYLLQGRDQIYMYDENDGNNNLIGYEWDGLTNLYCRNGDYMQGTALTLLNTYYTSQMTRDPDSIESTAGHEIGHALGLGHVSNPALMYPDEGRYYNWGIYYPQQDDINGVNSIYNTPC